MSTRCAKICLFAILWLCAAGNASAVVLRIVTYNIEADVDGVTAPRTGLDTVIEAIGEQNLNGVIQPTDVVALQETTSNAATVAPLVSALNAYYGAGVYDLSPFQATEVGNTATSGNGPNALIYNTRTLSLLESVGVGTPRGSSNGLYRQIGRYKLQPVDGTAASAFYVYVSHMKSSANSDPATVQAARAAEAQILRNDAAALPANSCILYTGDFNLDGSAEAAYQTLTAAGAGQAVDPHNFNPQDNAQDWSLPAFAPIATQGPLSLRYRDDFQFISQNVFTGAVSGGLRFLAGSYRVFGNNGSVAAGRSVNTASNTALDNLQGPITPAVARQALTTASDHLPVVADYRIDLASGTTAPGTLQFSAAAYSVEENAGSASVSVSRTSGSAGAISVNYATADATASAEVDYRAVSGTLSWADGDTTAKSFSIPIIDRGISGGGTKTLTLTLSGPTGGATLGTPLQSVLTISDNDPVVTPTPTPTPVPTPTPPPTPTPTPVPTPSPTPTPTPTPTPVVTPTPSTLSVVASEPAANATKGIGGSFRFTRTGDLSQPLAFSFLIRGSAANGSDYTLLAANKKFKAGKAVKTVRVWPANQKYYPGGKKTVKLVLQPNESYSVSEQSSAKVRIYYDE